MKKRLLSGFFLLLLLFIFVAILYKKPKEYFIAETPIKMCNGTGEKVIEVTCELYLQRYFFKGSELHGVIYVDGVKYTSLYDSQKNLNWNTSSNDFSAKLSGIIFDMPFINEEYYAERSINGRRSDLHFLEESIDNFSLTVLPDEEIIMFVYPTRSGDIYFGPAGNAEEYEEVMKKAASARMAE